MIAQLPIEIYEDERGFLCSCFKENYLNFRFVEDRLSYSKFGVLRGLHGDLKTGKLFIPIQGVFQFYACSLTTNDKLFLPRLSIIDKVAIFVPSGYLNGHFCLSEKAIMMYKWTEYYSGPQMQITVNYKDSYLNIPWEESITPIISERDKNGKSFLEVKEYYENRIR